MTDRELLENAAKAAGIEGEWEYNPPFDGRDRSGIYVVGHTFLWNPLTDDGDALRLAVKLRMCVLLSSEKDDAAVTADTGCSKVKFGNDPLAATRRAIVRAAAEIGKAMV